MALKKKIEAAKAKLQTTQKEMYQSMFKDTGADDHSPSSA